MVTISVIIPIYGVEKYIERCAKSLFEQDFYDVEFIFVDDCTKDNSITILSDVIKQYPQRSNQVRIIHHQENKGLPQARKTGIISAKGIYVFKDVPKGKYIYNCDSDDWLSKGVLKKISEIINRDNPDVVIMDYYITDGNHFNSKKGLINMNRNDLVRDMLIGKVSYSLWNKVFRKELYSNDIIFPMKSMGEDLGLTLQLLSYVDTVSYLPIEGYNYFVNPASMTKIRTIDDAICSFKCVVDNIDLAEKAICKMQKPNFQKEIVKLKHTKRFLFLYPYRKNEKAREMLINSFSEINAILFLNKYITLVDKFRFLLVFLKIKF